MGEMGAAPAIHYVGPILGSVLVASIVGAVYVYVRGQVFSTGPPGDAVGDSAVEPQDGDGGGTDVSPDSSAIERRKAHRLLEVLPDDERRILQPVIKSPGLTQIKVTDRSGFSRSKVSQTITDLEERGLLYRERQGRTYRVYPADDLEERL